MTLGVPLVYLESERMSERAAVDAAARSLDLSPLTP
jgi:hypothetical protein